MREPFVTGPDQKAEILKSIIVASITIVCFSVLFFWTKGIIQNNLDIGGGCAKANIQVTSDFENQYIGNQKEATLILQAYTKEQVAYKGTELAVCGIAYSFKTESNEKY